MANKEIDIVLVSTVAPFMYEANPAETNKGNSVFKVTGLSLVAGRDSLNLALSVTSIANTSHDSDDFIHFPLVANKTKWVHSPTEHQCLNSVINLTDYYQDLTQEILDKLKETYANINSPIPVYNHFAVIDGIGDVHEFHGYSFKRTLFILF